MEQQEHEGELSAAVCQQRGIACYEAEDFVGAAAWFSRAIAASSATGETLNETMLDAYQWRGAARCQGGFELAEAVADQTRVLEQRPDDAESCYWRGRTRIGLAAYRDALDDVRRAAELDRSDPDHLLWCGRARAALDDSEQALADWSRARALLMMDWLPADACPWDAGPARWEGYALALLDWARITDAGDSDTAADSDIDSGDAWFWRGWLCYHLQSRAAAHAALSRAIALQPDDAANLRWRGIVGYGMGDAAGAHDDFSQAIDLEPARFSAYQWRAMVRLNLKGDAAAARADLTAALEMRPDAIDTLLWRALAALDAGDIAAAQADVAQALEAGESPLALLWRGVLRAQAEGADSPAVQADWARAQALADDGAAWQAASHRARIAWLRGDRDAAREAYAAALWSGYRLDRLRSHCADLRRMLRVLPSLSADSAREERVEVVAWLEQVMDDTKSG